MKDLIKNADGLIFDLDGTLWDSVGPLTGVWNEIFIEEGVEPVTEDFVRSLMGKTPDEISHAIFDDTEHSDEVKQRVFEKTAQRECDFIRSVGGGKLFPDLIEVLEELSKKYKLFVVSNCQAGYIEAFYAAHDTEKYFTDFENPGRTGLDKASNIKLVVERNSLKSPVYIGDTIGDYNSATKAGVPFVFATYGFGDVDCDCRVDSLMELLEASR